MSKSRLQSPFRMVVMLCAMTACSMGFAEEDDRETRVDDEPEFNSPELIDGHFRLPPLGPPSIATDKIGNGRLPKSFRDGMSTPMRFLPESAAQRGADPTWSTIQWSAANTFSYPRYFEDRMLERHGHQRFGLFQPLASGARFFATVPMLPYLMKISPPCECEYSMGFYRSGSCAPKLLQRPPFDAHAAVVEAAAIAGGIVAFP